MQNTYYEYYRDSPELMAQLLASAYIAGLDASKNFEPGEIDEIVWDNELTGKLIAQYLRTLNSIHPTYLGRAD